MVAHTSSVRQLSGAMSDGKRGPQDLSWLSKYAAIT